MTTLVQVRDAETPTPPVGRRAIWPPPGVLLAALAVIAVRLPFRDGWLGKDEAGYLAVAQQWHAGGSSLYGNYWVDRPPLLITIFRAAALLGGTVPLRLIGIGAAVVAVLAVARAAQILVAGRRAATGAAIAAAALLVSPLAGAIEVNGELLAAPFIAIGLAGSLEMLLATSARRALSASVLAGASGLLAVLVKQNMLDVFVFAGVLTLLRARTIGAARLGIVSGGFLGGATLAGGAMAAWTLAHGTSLSGVWFAMYRFRIEADAVIAASPSTGVTLRGESLLRAVVVSGMVLVAMLLVVSTARARRDYPWSSPTSSVARAVPVALIVTLAYDAVSIYLGQNYWSHYLVQLAVPLALATGIAAAHRPRTSALVVAVLVTSAAGAAIALALHPAAGIGNRVGRAVAAVARPGDTIVTIWGHSDVTRTSGLKSPYPYLWELPARTLDPRGSLLTTTLAGPHAPTWVVNWSGVGLPGLDPRALKSTLRQDYRRIGDLHGHPIYLHDGVHRPAPTW